MRQWRVGALALATLAAASAGVALAWGADSFILEPSEAPSRLAPWATSPAPPPEPSGDWQIPQAAELAVTSGKARTAAEAAAMWQPVAAVAAEHGWTPWAYVVSAETGEILLDAAGGEAHTPASVMKVPTALTALDALEEQNRLATGTSYLDGTVYLWGEGDLLLSAGHGTGEVNGFAGLTDLAEATAAELQAQGASAVGLVYQDRMFQGDTKLPQWADQGVSEYAGEVAPYAIDAGRTTPEGWSFVPNSALYAAEAFSVALQAQGIAVSGVSPGEQPEGTLPLASVESATMLEQLSFMLRLSDNTLAEQYCHLAAKANGVETTFVGATANVLQTMQNLGVDVSGIYLEDCSGLSGNTKITGRSLVDLMKTSSSGSPSAQLLTQMLPRGGTNGTLTSRFEEKPMRGNLQAKTGSLGAVSSLAGVLTTTDGEDLLFAVGVDDVPDNGAYLARPHIDAFLVSLASGDVHTVPAE